MQPKGIIARASILLLSFIHILKKERCRFSFKRKFIGDYIGIAENRPELQTMVGKRERIEFAQSINKYDRNFQVLLLNFKCNFNKSNQVKRVDLLLTGRAVFLIRERTAKGSDREKLAESIYRSLTTMNITISVISFLQTNSSRPYRKCLPKVSFYASIKLWF